MKQEVFTVRRSLMPLIIRDRAKDGTENELIFLRRRGRKTERQNSVSYEQTHTDGKKCTNGSTFFFGKLVPGLFMA
ncbi:MAG: hypothetical protein A3J85_02160 [Desulfobacula sp. RIFOXYA12_FULL_46_16]|nr:MAG: hypothetical protein A2464_08760 [Deltaproteobacteria bacterium RIFOXYC2_FULL_48_10]OGR20479.1 MAG: hypothetical protein A3J85_02160 [Desulfobacula sp. RIFOXYA12_FULL_46_16]OGR38711.1 MAG: hypothetical protein A3J80_06820 [Desulfobacula sp. RIFOXYB2_FULL_45_6]